MTSFARPFFPLHPPPCLPSHFFEEPTFSFSPTLLLSTLSTTLPIDDDFLACHFFLPDPFLPRFLLARSTPFASTTIDQIGHSTTLVFFSSRAGRLCFFFFLSAPVSSRPPFFPLSGPTCVEALSRLGVTFPPPFRIAFVFHFLHFYRFSLFYVAFSFPSMKNLPFLRIDAPLDSRFVLFESLPCLSPVLRLRSLPFPQFPLATFDFLLQQVKLPPLLVLTFFYIARAFFFGFVCVELNPCVLFFQLSSV